MNTQDIIISVFLFLFVLHGFWKGFFASILHLAGLILAILLISKIGFVVKYSLMEMWNLGEIPAALIAYVLIFLIIMIITKIAISLIKRLMRALNLSFLDRIGGAVFGLLNGMLALGMIMILIDISPFAEEINQVTSESKIIESTKIISEQIIERVPFLKKEVMNNSN